MGNVNAQHRGCGTRPTNEVFRQLSDPVRRRILLGLVDASGGVVRLTDVDLDVPSSRRARIELYHRHLPKLASAGYVDWSLGDDLLRRGPNYDDVEPLVRLLREREDVLPTGLR